MAGATDDQQNYKEEWDACRASVDKFDQILVDLRKYGFSILTGLTTAGSFLGFSGPTKVIQIGVIIVTMALIMVLYWLDIYYQSLTYGASFRARFLEIFKLKRALSLSVSAFYGASRTGRIVHFLYIGFLIGLFILGLFAANIATNIGRAPLTIEDINNLVILLYAFIFTFDGIATIYVVSDLGRTEAVKDISIFIKAYAKKYRDDPTIRVEELEKKIMNKFDEYL